jgi:hypothetical protein
LAEPERVILRRLSIFAGAFSLEAASTVAASPKLAPLEVVDGLSNLAAKSLVAAEVEGPVARYRLLDTTPAYAREKLVQSGEFDAVARDAMPNVIGIFSGAPRLRPRSGQPTNGWQTTSREWTICAPRWTGPSRRTVPPRSA